METGANKLDWTEYQVLNDTISRAVTSVNIKTSLISQYVTRIWLDMSQWRNKSANTMEERKFGGKGVKILRVFIKFEFSERYKFKWPYVHRYVDTRPLTRNLNVIKRICGKYTFTARKTQSNRSFWSLKYILQALQMYY